MLSAEAEPKGSGNYKDLDKTRVKLCPNFTRQHLITHTKFLVTKLSEKSNFETPELKLSSLKHEFQARYVIMLN